MLMIFLCIYINYIDGLWWTLTTVNKGQHSTRSRATSWRNFALLTRNFCLMLVLVENPIPNQECMWPFCIVVFIHPHLIFKWPFHGYNIYIHNTSNWSYKYVRCNCIASVVFICSRLLLRNTVGVRCNSIVSVISVCVVAYGYLIQSRN